MKMEMKFANSKNVLHIT